ncbi:MAG: hypothetical protein ACRELX_02180 [Longimicrobiales bacterium]
MHRAFAALLPMVLATSALPAHAGTQTGNILMPVDTIERRLRQDTLLIRDWRGSRMEQDRTQRVLLAYPDSSVMLVKWAKAVPGGSAFNNEPRYELAAYEIQKLFLGEPEYVVPPTVARAVPLVFVNQYDASARATFDDAPGSVLVVLQYWLFAVTNENFWDEKRFERDTVYARHLANMNVLTHLIRHGDENTGNFLIALDSIRPRLFSVDNGVSFRSEVSDRGYAWRNLRVDRLPHATVERLRAVTEAELSQRLGVLVQFEVRNGMLIAVEPTANLDDDRGIRRRDGLVQIGLTRAEIHDVYRRLERLLERVDEGRITTF